MEGTLFISFGLDKYHHAKVNLLLRCLQSTRQKRVCSRLLQEERGHREHIDVHFNTGFFFPLLPPSLPHPTPSQSFGGDLNEVEPSPYSSLDGAISLSPCDSVGHTEQVVGKM